MRALKCVIAILLSLAIVRECCAWGPEGHRIAGVIAEKFLTPKTKAAIQEILGNDGLAKASTWADEIRDDNSYKWASPLHYINVPRDAKSVDMERDCHEGKCVLGAIQQYTLELSGQSHQPVNKPEALKFLIHFVQDVHQPLHVSYRDDKGGNDVHVIYGSKSTNLHHVWDTDLIDQWIGREDWMAKSRALADSITPAQAKKWAAQRDPVEWANESLAITRNLYATMPANNIRFDKPYFDQNIPIVEERLEAAGVRLAVLLNHIFDPAGPALQGVDGVSAEAPATAPATEPASQPATVENTPADGDATAFVQIIEGKPCGNAGGKEISLVNSHASRTIRVVVQKQWTDNGKDMTAKTTIVVRPGAGTSRQLGCSATKLHTGEVRTFTWSILSAEWTQPEH
ncbi:MAG TPA: S1/P1 nuclease [Phycisphaerales bacterium]|nr:S1/P1 nuclease [Phycisphaerales bacterium]